MAQESMALAPPDTLACVDTWPPCTLNDDVLAAYRKLMDTQEIVVASVRMNKATGVVTVRYTANCPHDWILDRLRKAKAQVLEEKAQQLRFSVRP